MIPVEGHPNLYRDEETKAIVNTSADYVKYVERRKIKLQEINEMSELKCEVCELKRMVNSLLTKIDELK